MMETGEYRGMAGIAAYERCIEAEPGKCGGAETGLERHVVRGQHQRGGADGVASGKAASAYQSIGRPATVWYCFWMGPPARLPVPAQGIRAKRRSDTDLREMEYRKPAGKPAGVHSIIRPSPAAIWRCRCSGHEP
jgi:transcription-repair coupling factor (superfamily II helicase)